jgi:hypothetical protein
MKSIHETIARLGGTLLLALSATFTARADYASTVSSQSPPVYYRLNENIPPSLAFATNSGSLGASAQGDYINSPSLLLPGPITGSVAVGFNGGNYVDVPYQLALNPSTFTIETWVNPQSASVSGGLLCVAASMHSGSPRSGWLIYQSDGTAAGAPGVGWYLRLYAQNGNSINVQCLAPQTPVPGTWTHLVYTFDGTNVKAYINGALVETDIATAFVPNPDADFLIGARSDTGFPWPGQAAEVAYYNGALSAARITAHYNATNNAATYAAAVLQDAPLAYYDFQAPIPATAFNVGTLGAAANGSYLGDVVPGDTGPIPPTYPGFEPSNLAAEFDYGGGSVQIPPLNFNTNTVTMSCWINISNPNDGSQYPGEGIIFCDGGGTVAGLTTDGSDPNDVTFGLGYVWNNDPNTYEWSPAAAGLPTLPTTGWAFVALVVQPTEAEIYIATTNGGVISFTSVTNSVATNPAFTGHPNQSFSNPTLVGTDNGLQFLSFGGDIDEPAIWPRSLSSGELYSQFASAVGGLAPIVFSSPPSPISVVEGDTLTIQANIGGTPDLSYQWFSNNVAIHLATNAVYSKPDFNVTADSGNYFVIVTNLYGSATSGVAVVTGIPGHSPVVLSSPVGGTIYPGGDLLLSVTATGGGLHYQWSTNGSAVLGATSSSYSVLGVTTNNAGSYSVIISNTYGSTNLGPFTVTVPFLAPGTYAQVVDNDAPDAWWRLNDLVATNGALMADVMGRHPGTYTNHGGLTVGNPGAITGGIAGTAIAFSGDGSYGYVPFFSSLADQQFSLEMWVKQTSFVNNVVAASSADDQGDDFGIGTASFWSGYSGGLVFGQGPGVTAGYDPTVLPGQWAHIVITHKPQVISGTTYAYSIYVNGVSDGYIWGDSALNSSKPFIIGGLGTGLSSVLSQFFVGSVDEVAFYSKVLSGSQIQAHYAAAYSGVPPSFSLEPQSQTAFVGDNVTFSAAAVGAPPITLQWKKNGANLPSQTNSTLIVSNVLLTANTDIYTVGATNAFGGTNSAAASIIVYYPPTSINLTNNLVCHLTFNGTYSDSSGHNNNGTPVGSPTFVTGLFGGQAVNISTDTNHPPNNYVTLGNPPDFQFGSIVNFSVSYWVQFPANATPEDLPFFCNATNSTGGPGVTLSPSGSGGWQWSLENLNTNGVRVAGAQNTLSDGSWHNVVESFNRTGNGSTYLDGELVNAVPITGIGDVDSGGVYNIGQDPTGNYPQSATYNLDDMGVWREALTDVESKSIYYVGHNYGKSFDTIGSPNLSCYIYRTPTGNVGVAWSNGTLVQSGSVTGPWTPVPGATLPFYQTALAPTNTFYRAMAP